MQIKIWIIVFIFLSSPFVVAENQKPSLQDFISFLPTGEYRKTMGDDKLCPSGHFSWVDNNTTLKIGGAEPVLFHTFNDKKTLDMSSATSPCFATTTNDIVYTTLKAPSQSVHQTIQNDCGDNKATSVYTLTISKIKNKTLVNLKMKVSHQGSKSLDNKSITCKYEK